jgi:hypothetical protein
MALDSRNEPRQPPTLRRDRRYPERKEQFRRVKALAAEQTSSRYDAETSEFRPSVTPPWEYISWHSDASPSIPFGQPGLEQAVRIISDGECDPASVVGWVV